ncbi:MAG: VOC family protein [Balneolaceae bacterium]|nr:VOC family protein [Balneolaceae bacterium]
MNDQFPTEEMELTHILVVSDLARSRRFYTEILGADLYREYGGDSIVFNFCGSWLLIVTGSGPTEDKPDTRFEAPQGSRTVSHAMTIRVPDCQQAYEILTYRGANFITPPYDRGGEIRCFFTDPDGHLFEISQVS